MKKILIAIMMLVTPAITYAASFDCKKATTAVELTICDDPTISSLDEQINALYKQAKKTTRSVEALTLAQRNWIKERNKATSVEELEAIHVKRRDQLLVIANPSATVAEEQAMKRTPVAMQRAGAELDEYELARLERMAVEDGKITAEQATTASGQEASFKPASRAEREQMSDSDFKAYKRAEALDIMARIKDHDTFMHEGVEVSTIQYGIPGYEVPQWCGNIMHDKAQPIFQQIIRESGAQKEIMADYKKWKVVMINVGLVASTPNLINLGITPDAYCQTLLQN